MTPEELDNRLRFAVDAARRAGDLALAHARNPDGLGVEIKGVQDVVTLADKAAEQALRAEVAAVFPHDAMLGEEEGITPGWDGRAPLWIVDPIDGTANYARRLPLWCISVGLYVDGVLVPSGGYQRIIAGNGSGGVGQLRYWSFNTAPTISAGAHTLTIRAHGPGAGGSPATVAGDSTSAAQGELTVVIVKQ